MLMFQWLLFIPFARRHKVVRSLLDRARMYQQRVPILMEMGRFEEAERAREEVKELLKQVEELNR